MLKYAILFLKQVHFFYAFFPKKSSTFLTLVKLHVAVDKKMKIHTNRTL
jgi:hypothetical protein